MIPQPDQVIAVVRNFEEMAVAFRTIKEILGLSNQFCDDVGGLTSGHTDKLIGPTRSKNWGSVSFDTFCEMFAIEFRMVINMDAVKRMQARWEGRQTSHVRIDAAKCSKALIERVKPAVYKAQMTAARAAYKIKIPAEQRSAIARKAAKTRWRRKRKQQREAKMVPATEVTA